MKLALLCVALAAPPCLWDSDTLSDELRGIPDAHALIIGRWVRHTDAYYEARVALLADKPDLALGEYDDLAVAYEHLGDRVRAIEVMARKADALAAAPDAEHQYRYHANLGTFYAHGGQLAEGLAELEKAVALNPDAHFGREPYQIELIRYVQAARADESLWKSENFVTHVGLASFSLVGHSIAGQAPLGRDERRALPAGLDPDKAYDALAGMLRFGGLEGPELYRSLGDLFAQQQHLNLAWWAWQRALEREHPAQDELRAAIGRIEKHWAAATRATGKPAPSLDLVGYRAQRDNADAWLAEYSAAEERALDAGEDPADQVVLERLVAEADRLVPPLGALAGSSGSASFKPPTWVFGAFFGALFGVVGVYLMRRRSAATARVSAAESRAGAGRR